MWLESKQDLYCSRRGRQVVITELIYAEGTCTCQIARQLFHWQCSGQAECSLADCPHFVSYLPVWGGDDNGHDRIDSA
ncbi:hypothetical protein [Desulfurispora thermophila]|uniref:hypothetical protein n=1 Tax=Desulfurispora thermophila TaxID=265470 RepID=UPI00037492A8|nr:hypothetical protein [Desulfurispora thermophila]